MSPSPVRDAARLEVHQEDADTVGSFPAMAGEVRVRINAGSDPDASIAAVGRTFAEVERQCTRFDTTSDLMRANSAGDQWCGVGDYCFDAIVEAAEAYARTGGLFDPRVLSSLMSMGYDHTIAFERVPFAGRAPEDQAYSYAPSDALSDALSDGCSSPPPPWHPEFDAERRAVRVGPHPIDLGGIGKGLAVRWAADRIGADCPSLLIAAGGDCYLRGPGPAGDGWQVSVEDPSGGPHPLAVLSLLDRAVATSSIRVRNWSVGGRRVHHLIDPRTGAPGGAGLAAVTVIHDDPAAAEIWTKVLFLQGNTAIAARAEADGLAALWVQADGRLFVTAAAEPYVIWTAA